MGFDYITPFGYFFRTSGWVKKLFIASLLTATLIGTAPVFGWAIVTVRRVALKEDPVFPEMIDWRDYWQLGGKFAAVHALWLLPILLAVILLYVPLLLADRLPAEFILAIFAGTLLCVTSFLFIYTVVYAFFIPVMMVSLTGGWSVRDAANPIHLWRLARPCFMGYLLLFLILGIGLVNVALVAATFTLFLLLPTLTVCLALVMAHFAGQVGMIDTSTHEHEGIPGSNG